MAAVIKSISPGSPASKTRIAPGDELVSINGRRTTDLLDYRYMAYGSVLRLVLKSKGGRPLLVRLKKSPGEDIGLEFEEFLLDRERSCSNKCIFCFIDQLPRGMRKTLYYKDDDTRLSFLQGNYVTLTNVDEREIRRIIDFKISPINVSVHTMNPKLRSFMLGSESGASGVDVIRRLAKAGITMHCQIVACPGINDGPELVYSMRQLEALFPRVASVSVVPVGLTKHREGLYKLTPYNKNSALETIKSVETFAEKCLAKHGARIFFCADELYIKAELPLPEDSRYEDYPQLENGVGMLRLLITEFMEALEGFDGNVKNQPFTVATGISAKPFIDDLVCTASEKCDKINGHVTGVQNNFFGDSVDVAGLVTGGDIIRALEGHRLGARLLIPRSMLRAGESCGGGVFLDDVTVRELESRFSVPVRIVEDGFDLFRAVIGD